MYFGGAYFAVAQFGSWLSIVASRIATLWLPAGLLVGLLLRLAPRRWPLFITAAVLADIAFDTTITGEPLPVALGFGAANALEAVTGAGLLRAFWFRRRPLGFATVGDVLAVSVAAALVAPVIGAGARAGVMAGAFGADYFASFPAVWSPHIVGVLLVAPIMLAVPDLVRLRRAWRDIPLQRRFEIAVIPIVVAGWTALFFTAFAPEFHVTILLAAILLWPALRSGQLGTAVAFAAMALVATRATVLGYGPFADPHFGAETNVLLLQVFLGVVAVSAHILAAATSERQSALVRLASFNSELEAHMALRTAELRESERRARHSLDELRSIYDTAPVGLCALDRDLRFVRVNERLAQMHRIPAAEHIGKTLREVLPHIADAIEPIYRRILATGEPLLGVEFESERKTEAGDHCTWIVNRLPLRDAGGTVIGINVVFEDITERKAAEARLRRLNETLEERVAERTAELELISAERTRLASVAENSPEFIGICDLSMRVIYLNPAGRRLVGIETGEELNRRNMLDYFVPEERAQVEREVFSAVLRSAHWVGELRFQHFGTGERIPVLYDVFPINDPTTGKPSHYATVTRDLRERKQAEEQLLQAQKMEAVGQLTGGVAHDFNNLLTAVIGNLELLEKKVARDRAAAKLLGSARRAAERGAELTSQLLAFARKQRLRPRPTDVNALVNGMTDLLQRTIGATVRIERRLAPLCWPVIVDPNQIELAILNLAINARDAMPLGGTLTIETGNIVADHPEAPATLPPGDYVMVSVADTGTGIRDDVLPRVFEPFFTTKDVGKGSGLGLSMVLGIAQQHGGGVDIASRIGRGTTVRLYLPRAVAAQSAEAAQTGAAATQACQAPSSCLLVVDDDRDVREFALECLCQRGHRVIAVESGQAALAFLDAGEPIDLALVDVVMPGMSGTAFATLAQQRHPGLRILFMSGYADAGLLSGAPNAPILTKPFGASDLAARIAEALADEKDLRMPNALLDQ